MPKVSVIIPVYNVDNFLEECLDSITNQTLTDIEVICINDGSTDNSPNILEKYAKKDTRIKIITQENLGHAIATNKGMYHANGEYMLIMASGDTLELNALEMAYKRAKECDVDLAIFKSLNYSNEKQIYYETESDSMNDIFGRVLENTFCYEDIEDLIFTMSVLPSSKLYKRKFIQENHILFPEGLIFDDRLFFWEVLFNADKMVFINEFLLIKRIYSTSLINKKDLIFLDSIEINELIWRTFKKYNHFEKHKKELYKNRVLSAYNLFSRIKEKYKEIFFQKMKKSFMDIVDDEELYEDFMECIDDDTKEIFSQVLCTQNSKDFELLRNYSKFIRGEEIVK